MLRLKVNGHEQSVDRPMTVREFLEAHDLVRPFMAVARNGDVLLKSEYAQVTLQDGDTIEIVQMVGGG